jgi:hypothetical protein
VSGKAEVSEVKLVAIAYGTLVEEGNECWTGSACETGATLVLAEALDLEGTLTFFNFVFKLSVRSVRDWLLLRMQLREHPGTGIGL